MATTLGILYVFDDQRRSCHKWIDQSGAKCIVVIETKLDAFKLHSTVMRNIFLVFKSRFFGGSM